MRPRKGHCNCRWEEKLVRRDSAGDGDLRSKKLMKSGIALKAKEGTVVREGQ